MNSSGSGHAIYHNIENQEVRLLDASQWQTVYTRGVQTVAAFVIYVYIRVQ